MAPPDHPTCPRPRLQVFDFDLWKRHRSSSRYWRHITGIFESRTVSPIPGMRTLIPRAAGSPEREPRCAAARVGFLPHRQPPTRLNLIRAPPPRLASPPLSRLRSCPASPAPVCPTQVSGLAAPLAYVMTLSSAVAAYHVLAEVRRRHEQWAAAPAAAPGTGLPSSAQLRCAPCTAAPDGSALLRPSPPQAGYLMEVPDLKLASNAPFGLTSFALSLLLVSPRPSRGLQLAREPGRPAFQTASRSSLCNRWHRDRAAPPSRRRTHAGLPHQLLLRPVG